MGEPWAEDDIIAALTAPLHESWSNPPCRVCSFAIREDQAYVAAADGTPLRHIPGECVKPGDHVPSALIGTLPVGFRPKGTMRTLINGEEDWFVEYRPDGAITMNGPMVHAHGLDGMRIEPVVDHPVHGEIDWSRAKERLVECHLYQDGSLEDRNGKGWWDNVHTAAGDINTAGDLLAWLLGIDERSV